eukprot:CAMPEP_0196802246 /NCGR_PEP_ID=MMETSP1362-20130617/1885_1 /TAXON_ID=163516 /ORGANISM="Leptocylindrus danicus, Strain CCMP1856" /LENGTH=232 /DNA_ID=CAMNT_0042173485 /DNA_START=159 /DNA_END=857 /DNA_ORIENTATION=-
MTTIHNPFNHAVRRCYTKTTPMILLHPQLNLNRCKRMLSASSGDSLKMPEPNKSAWERGAIAVKNIDVTNPYLESIRQTHDPAMHVKTIEDELKGTIGKALGKQGQKILMWVKVMQQERDQYDSLLVQGVERTVITAGKMDAIAKNYNSAREKAIKARWELVVHRQAAGFIVNNHKFVHEKFPIADALPLDHSFGLQETDTSRDGTVQEQQKKKTKKFGDQLDWWQRIGRWR